jgi:uncharacterized phiE125 gp8 family phage protein
MKIEVITPAIGTVVSLAEVKGYLRIDLTDINEDTLLDTLILASIESFQSYTGAILRPTGYRVTKYSVNYSNIVDLKFVYPISSIELREYKTFNDATFQTSLLFRDVLDAYSYIAFQDAICIDSDTQFKVEFTAGFTNVPNDVKVLLMMMVSFMYENRGDCACSSASGMPTHITALMNRYRVSVY